MNKLMYRELGTDTYSQVYEILSLAVEEGVYVITHMDSTVQFLPITYYEVVMGEDEQWSKVPAVRGFLEGNK